MTEETKTKKLTKAEQDKVDQGEALKAQVLVTLELQNTAYATKGFDQQANLTVSSEEQQVSLRKRQ